MLVGALQTRQGPVSYTHLDVYKRQLYISASTGENVEKLLLRVESEREAGAQEVRLLIPFSRYALVSRLHAMGGVLEQRHSEAGVEIRMRITPQNVKFACREGAKVLGGEKM